MSQSQVKQRYTDPGRQSVYAEFIRSDRNPTVKPGGSDDLGRAFFSGFMNPSAVLVARLVKGSMAEAARQAGIDRRQQCEKIAQKGGVRVHENCNSPLPWSWSIWSGAHWLGQSKAEFATEAEAWFDAATAISANIVRGITPESANAIAQLRTLLPPGSMLYTLRRHQTRTGGSQELSVLFVLDGTILDLTRLVSVVLKSRVGDHKGMVVYNVGGDSGVQLVGQLGHALHNDTKSLRQEWL